MGTAPEGFVDATFYAQVEPDWSRYGTVDLGDGERGPRLDGAKVVRITQTRPGKPVAGTVLVKLTLRVPERAFRPLRPTAVVLIPADLTVAAPLEVTAEDPGAES